MTVAYEYSKCSAFNKIGRNYIVKILLYTRVRFICERLQSEKADPKTRKTNSLTLSCQRLRADSIASKLPRDRNRGDSIPETCPRYRRRRRRRRRRREKNGAWIIAYADLP
jgi:hypothetical protein